VSVVKYKIQWLQQRKFHGVDVHVTNMTQSASLLFATRLDRMERTTLMLKYMQRDFHNDNWNSVTLQMLRETCANFNYPTSN
jgi:hypothetical protein